jgi:heme A synthase
MKTPRSESNTKLVRWLYVFVLVVMAFTGFGQMPIFKRYYVSEIPGMGWAADFYLTHTLHYLGAMVLFALFAYAVTAYLLKGKNRARLTTSAYVRLVLLGGLVVTGIFRVFKNLPDVTFSPGVTLFIDLAHLGFMMLFGMAALIFIIFKQRWLELRRG